jgi:hypothetical protein
MSFILIISKDTKKEYFGTVIGYSSFVVIMFILGVIQFIPSVYKGRKPLRLIIMWIMGFLWTVSSIMLITGDLPNYYKDIDKIISSDYSSYEGRLNSYHIVHGKSTTTYFIIEDKEFHVKGKYDSNFLIEGRKYRIEYLPHTKYVINLYRYGN